LLPRLDVVPVLLLLPDVVEDMLLPLVEFDDVPDMVEPMLPFDGIDMPGDIVPDVVPPVDGIAPVLPDCAPIPPLVDWEPIAPEAPDEPDPPAAPLAPAPPPAEPPADCADTIAGAMTTAAARIYFNIFLSLGPVFGRE
jgi:hypothetical protein